MLNMAREGLRREDQAARVGASHPATLDEWNLRFDRGGELSLLLLRNLAPRTIERIRQLLPFGGLCLHSRWSGREINVDISTGAGIPRENQTMQTAPGDVVYWREWERESSEAAESIALYYGPELTRYHKGPQLVNVFARIPQSQWSVLEEVGIRIWRHGGEPLLLAEDKGTRTKVIE